MAISMAGCAAIDGQQKPITGTEVSQALVCPTSGDIRDFERETSPIRRRQIRDDAIASCLAAADNHYRDYKLGIQRESVTTNLVVDSASQILTIAAPLTRGGTPKTLAGIAGGFIGVGAAINKDVFYQQTLPALEAAIDAQRSAKRAVIYEKESDDPAAVSYSPASAAADIREYESTGSIYAGLSELSKAAKKDADEATQGAIASQKDKALSYTAPVPDAATSAKLLPLIKSVKSVSDKSKLDSISQALMGATFTDADEEKQRISNFLIEHNDQIDAVNIKITAFLK